MDGGYGGFPTTSYGAQGMAGGGGFMPGETNNPTGWKNEKNSTLRPVTIKQILDSTQAHPDASFQIDGADVGAINFVGQVRNISAQTTNTTYKIDDGTGEVEVKLWWKVAAGGADGDDEDLDNMDIDGTMKIKKPTVTLNGFVRVFGNIKSFGNKKHVTATVLRSLTDINEFHCHLLEATVIHLFFTKGPPPTKGADGASVGEAANSANIDGGVDPSGRTLPQMSAGARRIYNLLKSEPQSNEGLHMQLIASKLNMPVQDVAKAGDELLTSAVIFSTVDENTWAILEY